MTHNEKNTATILHLSALSQYFIPFGNYILPTIIWSAKKESSPFVDQNGRNVLNFQLSIFLYSLILLLIAIPTLVYGLLKNTNLDLFLNSNHHFDTFNSEQLSGFVITLAVTGFLFATLKVSEFILIIIGAVSASNGQSYKYPLTLNFIK